MGKRARITALVTTLCLCISLFVMGVLAATSATLNVTSTLNFTADGVYVMVDASLKQGSSASNATVLSGEGAPTGQTTYKAYSYPRASGQDYPNGEPSTTYFVNESGAQTSTWAIGDIYYTSSNTVVVYEFLVSNYSNFEVQGTVEGVSDVLDTYVTSGQLSIVTYTGTSSESATATGSPTYTFTIPARTNETTPGVTCYKIAVTLNNFMNELATGQIEMNVSFIPPPEPVYEYFTYSGNSITGLSDIYYNLEIKPETLVIPSADGKGNKITEISPPINDVTGDPISVLDLDSNNIIIQEGITKIGDYAFFRCTALTSIEIPNSVTSIGSFAFSRCTALTSIEIPEGVTSIGSYAFDGCGTLTNITLPNSLTSIGSSAFSYCDSLISIVIPSGVTSIGSSAFISCDLLQITVASDNANYSSDNGSLYNKAQTELIRGAGGTTVNILDTVTRIGNYAFSGCTSLGHIEIPERVTSIGYEAFYYCTSLKNITIPSSVTSIERNAFWNCKNLTSLTINTQAGYVWQKASSTSSSASWITVDVSKPTQNATWFKNTSGYYNYYWRQIEESAV